MFDEENRLIRSGDDRLVGSFLSSPGSPIRHAAKILQTHH
jgi:hypothetical protein